MLACNATGTEKLKPLLKDLDQKFRIQNCQVLLLVDNAFSHFYNQSNIANIDELYESDESNINSEEEIFDNDLESKISTSICENRQGHSRPRLIKTNQGLNNSCDNYDNCDNYDSCGSHSSHKDHSTDSISHEEIELATCIQNIVLEQQEQNISTLVVDLTSQDPNLKIKNQLNVYLDLNNLHILTEKKLNDSEIIEVVLDEANQFEHGDPDDSDEEEPEILISEGLTGLNKFIYFFK
ncbi:17910_t:CDS:2 [Racocetra fulgida]|uniref:17910_t:CDS:1 n=1 Tax=Racocetra fulgida TaxID=60492 RepID=A0A9N9BEQ7_9GLOM|nr:17910_t:CDS:2 [Racocetra fulgida]